MTFIASIHPTRRKPPSINNLQQDLNDTVEMFLEWALRPADTDEDDAHNQRVQTMLREYRDGRGIFASDLDEAIRKVCEAVKRGLG
jgi:hypothetical protein